MLDHPHNGSPTSKTAAIQIERVAATQGQMILAFLRSCGCDGATCEEIQRLTNLKGDSVRPRLIRLRDDDLVLDSGMTRQTEAKRHAVVWVAMEK